ncbi:MAG: hypothetical protein AAGK17_10145 [Pseudomonadota bacterium]
MVRPFLVALAVILVGSAAAAKAEQSDRLQFDGLIELRAVESELETDQGDSIDSTGFGGRARLGVTFDLSDTTTVRAEGEARVFTFRDENREDLETFIGRVEVRHDVSDNVEVRAFARRYENIPVLEAFSADQTSIGGRVQWEKGNDRARLTGEYREREYDTLTGGDGDGYRVAAQYNRRLGPYHWLRFDARADRISSDNEPRRSYSRQVARVKYSLPVAKRLRIRPSLEYRTWDYDSRIARGDPDGALRKDSYFAPGADVAWSHPRTGIYATASAEHRFRTSNDERFDANAWRIGVRFGVRF